MACRTISATLNVKFDASEFVLKLVRTDGQTSAQSLLWLPWAHLVGITEVLPYSPAAAHRAVIVVTLARLDIGCHFLDGIAQVEAS